MWTDYSTNWNSRHDLRYWLVCWSSGAGDRKNNLIKIRIRFYIIHQLVQVKKPAITIEFLLGGRGVALKDSWTELNMKFGKKKPTAAFFDHWFYLIDFNKKFILELGNIVLALGTFSYTCLVYSKNHLISWKGNFNRESMRWKNKKYWFFNPKNAHFS